MSEIKILPCPFCGGEAEIEEHKFWNDITRSFDIKTYGVVCHECNASSFQYFRIEQDAIIKWNTRKPMERILTRLKLLKRRFSSIEFGIRGIIEKTIEIVKEEGGIHEED